jgi:hypothetical protein
MAVEVGAFEVTRVARERYGIYARLTRAIPTGWEAYLAGFKAGGVFLAHTSGTLMDPGLVLAIRSIATVFGLAPAQAEDRVEFKAGAAWMLTTSGKLSDPAFRQAIQVLAEVMLIERGPALALVCVHCGAVG